jgi:hypothetical protein
MTVQGQTRKSEPVEAISDLPPTPDIRTNTGFRRLWVRKHQPAIIEATDEHPMSDEQLRGAFLDMGFSL